MYSLKYWIVVLILPTLITMFVGWCGASWLDMLGSFIIAVVGSFDWYKSLFNKEEK